MPSNDERREVAARLRDVKGLRDAVMNTSLGAHMDEIEAQCEWEATCKYLADLIEPEPERTCRIEKRRGDWCCTECDAVVGTDDPESELYVDGNVIEMWNFCPNCGARVKEGE